MLTRVYQLVATILASLGIIYAFVFTVNAGWFLQSTPRLAIAINETYGDRLRAANIESMSIRMSLRDTLLTDYRITIREPDGRVRKERFVAPRFTTYRFHLTRDGDFYNVRSDHEDLPSAGEYASNTIGPIVGMMIRYVDDPTNPLVAEY